MTTIDWIVEFVKHCEAEHVLIRESDTRIRGTAQVLEVDAEDWGRVAEVALASDCRWVAVWADHREDDIRFHACLEKRGDYIVVITSTAIKTPLLPSHTPYYPAADRPERHTQDMYGVVFSNHPDSRRWVRHQAWRDHDFPLRKDFPAAGKPLEETPPDAHYPFFSAQGAGVYEIPVGPVHAGIIEPGHFRFQAVGETVLNLEERLGYVHKGIEKIAEGRDASGVARLAGRISGDTTAGHTWAACMAMEHALEIQVPARALTLRAVLAERERIANHLWDIAAICNDVGFAFPYFQFGRLREDWLRLNQRVFGHRLLMDVIVPGGIRADIGDEQIAALRQQNGHIRDELGELLPILEEHPSLEDRLLGTGELSTGIAKQLGALGYVGRASGIDADVRRDHAYAPYDRLTVKVPVYTEGDVASRLRVRAEESEIALTLIEELLQTLPDGAIQADWRTPGTAVEGLGVIEGWRGEIITYIRLGADGLATRFYPRDPSWHTWPALEQLIHGNIVPDFPVCNKSINGSYSGHDL